MKSKSLWIILGIVAVIVLWVISANNKMVSKQENAKGKWADVQADYQRRLDLVSQAINIVKGAGNYESSTLENVIKARNNVIELDKDDLTEENVKKFQAAYDRMTQEMNKAINVTVERYPELTATQNYRDFQAQIEGCENRINVSRKKYNDAVKDYNVSIKKFPNSIIAGIFGFDEMGYFEASEGAEKAPSTESLL